MPKPKQKRLSAEARKEAILTASLPLFAERGLAGVSTRELSEVCGVSEGLIFLYFPSKEALYQEILNRYEHRIEPVVVRLARELEPSTRSLTQLVYMFIRLVVILEPSLGDPTIRMFYRSFTEDGVFARRFLKRLVPDLRACFMASVEAARAQGDIVLNDSAPENLFWYVQHLATASCLGRLQQPAVIRYKGRIDSIAADMTRFALRGIGLQEAAIQAHFTAETRKGWNQLERGAL